jgi:hypothetical protein
VPAVRWLALSRLEPKGTRVIIDPAGVAPRLPPLKLPPLSALPSDQAVENLIRAHYDPSRMGLRELAYRVDLALPQLKTRMQGTGTWQRDGSVEVKVRSVERKGKTELAPADPGIGTQVWTALEYQTEGLLEGMGKGFLSQRLAQWKKLKGESRLEGKTLLLRFHEESGETVVSVGEGWVVQKVESFSPKKVKRWMEYRHRLEQGYNIVTFARMRVHVEEGADIPPGGVKMLKSGDGLTFQLEYGDVAGYQLPVQLRKTSSRGEEALLRLVYTAAK